MEESFGHKIIAKIVRWLDPKLAKYRKAEKKPPYTPKTEKEFIGVLKRTPENILNSKQRNIIAGAMTFSDIPVSLIMTERKDMMFLSESDFLGPLLLDKMYKTNSDTFPVLDKDGEVCGIVCASEIDPLKISEDQPISQFICKNVFFARSDYSLEMLLTAFVRTNSTYMIVIDKNAHIIGSVSLDELIATLYGHHLRDSFNTDDSPYSVARRTER